MSVMRIETWKKMGFFKDDLIDSRIRLSAANKGALQVLGRTPIIALNLGEHILWMSFLVVENLDDSDQFILGRNFIWNFDVTIDLKIDKETYDSPPLSIWLDKSGKPREDYFELPVEHEAKKILKRNLGMPIETMLQSKIARKTIKAKKLRPR